MDVRARGHPEPALPRRAEIGHDVAEEVVRDDYVKPRRVLDDVKAKSIDIYVLRLYVRILRADFVEDTKPELVRVAKRVRLVRHDHMAALALASELERSPQD